VLPQPTAKSIMAAAESDAIVLKIDLFIINFLSGIVKIPFHTF
jgi:hypothetical protein